MHHHPENTNVTVEDKREGGSDAEGHYDIDGASLACGQVVAGSGGIPLDCTSRVVPSPNPAAPELATSHSRKATLKPAEPPASD